MQSQLTVMYPSNTSLNANDLISYPIQPFWSRPFSIESNPTSKQETHCTLPPPPPLSIFQFPSPFEDNEIFLEQHHDFLLHHHQSLAEAVNVNMEMEVSINSKIPGKSGGIATEQIPRKRSSKRDRHSKIKTARGLRDRRMRLSLEVAKRFFGLQDMLGFDKASKTVEWLLNQAKVEIKQLAREKNIHHPSCRSGGGSGAKSASSTSECEGVSSLDEVAASGNQEQKGGVVKRRIKLSRKSAFKPVARESREKARERARERTKQIKMRRLAANEPKQCNEATTNHNMNRLGGSWNPFETVEESAGTQSQSLNPSLDVLAEAEEPSSQAKEHHLGTVEDIAHEDSLVIMSKWSPTMIFNSLNNSGILHEHQFAEFQSLGKPWEAYNNHNI